MKKKLVQKIVSSALFVLVTASSIFTNAMAKEDIANANTTATLDSEDYVGIEAFKRAENDPIIDKVQTRAATNTSPAMALSHAGSNILDTFSTAPQAKWFKWSPWNDTQGSYAFDNLYSIYFSAPANYELLLVDSTLTNVWLMPTNTDIVVSYADLASLFGVSPTSVSTLNLYLVAQVSSGSFTSAYNLYYGATYKSGSSNYINTGFAYNFGTLNVPPPQFWNSPAYIFSGMVNNSSIPEFALINQMWLTNDGTGSGMINAEKFLYTASGFSQSMILGIELSSIPRNVHPVKQEYRIQARLRQSTSLTWRPQMRFTYIYPVVASNIRFVPVIDIR
jgi:hypothetical protein